MSALPKKRPESVKTRQSLLIRLKDWKDIVSWQAFFDTYWRLIYTTANKAGLSPEESEDVVQETIFSVAKQLPKFEYDAEKGSFRSWLLSVTYSRIADRYRERKRTVELVSYDQGVVPGPEGDAFPDMVSRAELEEIWDREWDSNLMEAAINNVKKRVSPKNYQVYDLLVFKEMPLGEVTKLLGVSRAKAYMTRFRVDRYIEEELKRIRKEVV